MVDGVISFMSLSGEESVVPAGGKALVNTHISLAVPIGTYGRVAPRSGLGEYLIKFRGVD